MEGRKPNFEKRLRGLRVAIWENDDNGKLWHNVALTRRYKDKNGDWQDSNCFSGVADLTLLDELISQAKTWIASRQGDAAAA